MLCSYIVFLFEIFSHYDKDYMKTRKITTLHFMCLHKANKVDNKSTVVGREEGLEWLEG